MATKIYTDKDADLSLLKDRTVAVVGYGTQGASRALNMRDSGVHVIVGADKDHIDATLANKDGFEVVSIEDCARRADVFELEIPDMAYRCAKAYNERIMPFAKADHMVCLSSAMNYYYGHMEIPTGADAVCTAAKAPGSAVRS